MATDLRTRAAEPPAQFSKEHTKDTKDSPLFLIPRAVRGGMNNSVCCFVLFVSATGLRTDPSFGGTFVVNSSLPQFWLRRSRSVRFVV